MRGRFAPESVVGTQLLTSTGLARIRQHLASGGLSFVYLADVEGRGDPVALKLLRPELQVKTDIVARFEREALAASRVEHENVLRVFEPAQSNRGYLFFTAELLVGVDLADVLSTSRSVAPGRAVRIASAAAAGLGAAHALGVVHRDVKPENLFLQHRSDGREVVKVVDFGSAWLGSSPSPRGRSARITMTTGFVGTPGYLAPEQADGAEGQPAADIYSLGVVLYEMLVGRPPFSAPSPMEMVMRHIRNPAPPVTKVSPELAAIVARMLAKTPGERHASTAELIAALANTPEAAAH